MRFFLTIFISKIFCYFTRINHFSTIQHDSLIEIPGLFALTKEANMDNFLTISWPYGLHDSWNPLII